MSLTWINAWTNNRTNAIKCIDHLILYIFHMTVFSLFFKVQILRKGGFCAAYICDSVAVLYPFSYLIPWRIQWLLFFFFLISTECDSHYIYHLLTKMYVPLLFKFYFNLRLITLQYCGGFCHTFTWISHRCTCAPHPDPTSPSHPSGSSQCTSPEHPASCIEPGLTIYFTYDNIHVSMLFSQIIPPLPSPTDSKSLFFTSVSPLLSCI